eukprot:scaffold287629_cov21-Tisochrysis_lutea.AAC.1
MGVKGMCIRNQTPLKAIQESSVPEVVYKQSFTDVSQQLQRRVALMMGHASRKSSFASHLSMVSPRILIPSDLGFE